MTTIGEVSHLHFCFSCNCYLMSNQRKENPSNQYYYAKHILIIWANLWTYMYIQQVHAYFINKYNEYACQAPHSTIVLIRFKVQSANF
jgi:hypothetical protein